MDQTANSQIGMIIDFYVLIIMWIQWIFIQILAFAHFLENRENIGDDHNTEDDENIQEIDNRDIENPRQKSVNQQKRKGINISYIANIIFYGKFDILSLNSRILKRRFNFWQYFLCF